MTTTSCCPSSAVEAITDYAIAPGGCKSFLERIGALEAYRLPGSRVSPGSMRTHTIPLKPPFPPAELQSHFNGESPPDQGKTLEWPHPDLEREAEEQEA